MEMTPSDKIKAKTNKTDLESHSKGELCTVAERGVVRTVDGRLSGESGVKLAHIFVRLLQRLRWENRQESSVLFIKVCVYYEGS